MLIEVRSTGLDEARSGCCADARKARTEIIRMKVKRFMLRSLPGAKLKKKILGAVQAWSCAHRSVVPVQISFQREKMAAKINRAFSIYKPN